MAKLNTVVSIKTYLVKEIAKLRATDSPESLAAESALQKLLNEILKAES